MSQHKVEVVPIQLKPHPNADSLSIVEVYGYTVCVRTADWQGRDRGAYVPPDSLVDSTRPEFNFLAGHERIKVKRLRGIISMGLLVPTEAPIGTDLMEALGVKHYEPPLQISTNGEAAPPPKVYAPHYDVESARRYFPSFNEGEPVIVTEKLHGASGRWVFDGEKIHASSRIEWKREGVSIWWKALELCPWLEVFLRSHPWHVVYGEVFGRVQDLKYERELDVRVFDVLLGNRWLDVDEARTLSPDLAWVPEIARTNWSWPSIAELAEGKSMLADHVREGVVIKPMIERTNPEIGRVQLKLIGNGYLERA